MSATLSARLGLNQPALSHHLALLRVGSLISTRCAGHYQFYSVRPGGLGDVVTRVQVAMDSVRPIRAPGEAASLPSAPTIGNDPVVSPGPIGAHLHGLLWAWPSEPAPGVAARVKAKSFRLRSCIPAWAKAPGPRAP